MRSVIEELKCSNFSSAFESIECFLADTTSD